MARKNFAEGIDGILGEGSPQIPKKQVLTTKAKTKKSTEGRTSIIIDLMLLEKLKAVVFWDRSTLKVELENAIKLYLNSKDNADIDQALWHFRVKKPSGKIKG